jgi:hypothetical protein
LRLSENYQPFEGASLILFLAFLFPVALYCLILGVINRRDRPLMVSGAWDFVGILFAASGFLLFVGPGVLGALYERWRYFLLFGQGGSVALSEAGYYFWVTVWGLYYVAVVAGAAFILWRRRKITAIYNVDVPALQAALTQVLERMGLSWTRAGKQFFIKPGDGPRDGQAVTPEGVPASQRALVSAETAKLGMDPMAAPGIRPFAPLLGPVRYLALLEVETFGAMCHATLRWPQADPLLRQEIEAELDKALQRTFTRSNGSGGWFLCVGGLMLLATFLCMILLILVNMPPSR